MWKPNVSYFKIAWMSCGSKLIGVKWTPNNFFNGSKAKSWWYPNHLIIRALPARYAQNSVFGSWICRIMHFSWCFCLDYYQKKHMYNKHKEKNKQETLHVYADTQKIATNTSTMQIHKNDKCDLLCGRHSLLNCANMSYKCCLVPSKTFPPFFSQSISEVFLLSTTKRTLLCAKEKKCREDFHSATFKLHNLS